MDSKTSHSATYSQFACIGAGFSGIGIGATLKRWYGINDIQIFEREADLGGTWFINKYPGCACDVPSVLYSYSFAPNAEWTRVLAPFHELQDYLQKVASDYGLKERIAFNSTVERCEWSEARQRWRITVRDNGLGTVYYHECQFLYSGVGQLIEPRFPDIPGIDNFQGSIFHASRWPQGLSLKDKKVVVVGNGCTAAQIVPAIVDDTKSITQFLRSKHWILPPLEMPSLSTWRFLFKHVPGVLKFMRFSIFAFGEYHFRGFYMTKSGEAHRKHHEKLFAQYMRDTAPEKYHDLLIPEYALGCKRRIYDPGYLPSLNNEKITLTDTPILEFVPEGVKTADGVTEADVIVLATGYATNTFLPRIDLIGRGGKTAKEHWDESAGVGAYNTSLMSGFPNFFFLLGPNTVTGHTSTILAIENAANYSMRIIKPVLEGKAVSVDCLPEAEARYIEDIQAATDETVFFRGGCNSWYIEEKDGKRPHNATTYPFSQIHYWYRSMFPVQDDLPPRSPKRLSPVRQFLKVALYTIIFLMSAKAVRAFRAAVKEHGFKNLVMGYGAMAMIRVQMLRMKLQRRLKSE